MTVKNSLIGIIVVTASLLSGAAKTIVVVGNVQACDYSLTLANKGKNAPLTGWCEALKPMLKKGARMINWAGRRSTKILLNSGYWQKHVVNTIASGRYVIVTFGTDDASTDKTIRTEASKDFAENLKAMLADIRERGGIPVLVSPVIRCTHGGRDRRTLSDNELFGYARSMKEVAQEDDAAFVDLTTLTFDFFRTMPPEEMRQYFMFYAPGVEKNYPKGISSITLLNRQGAEKAAELFVLDAKRQNLPIAELFK